MNNNFEKTPPVRPDEETKIIEKSEKSPILEELEEMFKDEKMREMLKKSKWLRVDINDTPIIIGHSVDYISAGLRQENLVDEDGKLINPLTHTFTTAILEIGQPTFEEEYLEGSSAADAEKK